MSRIRDFLKKRKKLGNKGEAMILMIVAIGIIMFLGMSLLYATATAFMIRNSERQSEETFNSADTGMDLLKNRLTEVESKAAEQGYAKVLNLYADSKSDQVNFKNSFIEGLTHTYVSSTGDITISDTASSGDTALFPGGTTSAVNAYSETAIQDLFRGKTSAEGDTYELKCDGTAKLSNDKKSLTLKGIKLTYTRHDGYVTSVTTDIKLKVPEITASLPSQGFEKNILNGYSCVADQGLRYYDSTSMGDTAASGKIEGSVYAGSAYTKTENLTVSEGNKIIIGRTRITSRGTDGSVTFSDGRTDGQLNIETSSNNAGGIDLKDNSELWIQDINLLHNASITTGLNSNIYVADDLNFEDGGSATIKGNYFGFGNGSRASQSSSIIFNSPKKVKINLSGAQSLMLAGRSFIMQDDKSDTSDEIGMGSSITAKSEQRAYLIPTEGGKIPGSNIQNPQIVDSTDVDTIKRQVDTLVDTAAKKGTKIYGMKKSLSEYWTNGEPIVKVLSYPLDKGAKYKQYYFFSFNSTAEANAYFKDYFEANRNDVNSYISQYAEISGLKSSVLRTAGTGLTNGNDGLDVTEALNKTDDIDEMNKLAEKYQKQYKNLSETLDPNTSGSKTPFYSMIDIDNLHKTCGSMDSKTPVPAAWWADVNNIKPVYEDDLVKDPYSGGGKNLVVVNTLYRMPNKGNAFVMFVYENQKLYMLNLGKSGDSLRTTLNSSDINKYLVIQNGKEVTTKLYTGSVDSSDSSNLIAIANSITEVDPRSYFDKIGGYVVWGDVTPEMYTKFTLGDNEINFLIVEGNVTIPNDFHGLIMCSGILESRGGKVTLENNIGSKILAKTHIWSGNTGGSKKSSSEDWTLGKMVVYENWKKN